MQNRQTENSIACQAKIDDHLICGRELVDNKYCIFHSDDIANKKHKFEDAFWQEFDRQKREDDTFDFSKFIFPAPVDFRNIEFVKDVSFNFVIFHKCPLFNNVIFQKGVHFTGVKFLKGAIFDKVQTFDSVSFNFAVFSSKTIFSDIIFHKSVHFTNTIFEDIVLFADFRFKDHLFLRNCYFNDVRGLFDYITQNLKVLNKRIGDFCFMLGDKSVIRYPFIHRMTQDAWFLQNFYYQNPKLYKVWKLTSDCGRSVTRWAFLSLGIALFFAIIYILIGPSAFKPRSYTWFSFIYYSVVTFTTLGFGDITPIKWYSEIIVALEVIIGYIMLGGLISIFSNKLARRS